MGLTQRICRWILFKRMGFRVNVALPLPDKYVIALAPHTSNWDFIMGILYLGAMNFKCNFMIKKEWFFWPMGYLMKALGGIPVYRSKNLSTTDVLAKTCLSKKSFHLCITPEGTRKATREWKRGFYYIAHKAGIPIYLYGLDYKRRLIECTKSIIPNGDYETQMAEIKDYFRQYTGKIPANFAL